MCFKLTCINTNVNALLEEKIVFHISNLLCFLAAKSMYGFSGLYVERRFRELGKNQGFLTKVPPFKSSIGGQGFRLSILKSSDLTSTRNLEVRTWSKYWNLKICKDSEPHFWCCLSQTKIQYFGYLVHIIFYCIKFWKIKLWL